MEDWDKGERMSVDAERFWETIHKKDAEIFALGVKAELLQAGFNEILASLSHKYSGAWWYGVYPSAVPGIQNVIELLGIKIISPTEAREATDQVVEDVKSLGSGRK